MLLPYVLFVFLCRKLSPYFESWITGVFSPYVGLCMILHTMSLGKSLQLLCIWPFSMLCLSAISMMFVKTMLAVLVGMVACNWFTRDSGAEPLRVVKTSSNSL